MDTPIQIGGRRELFIDDFMVESLEPGAEKRLHHPERRETVFQVNAPQEKCNCSSYHTIVQDGDRWLFYYRANISTSTPDGEYQDDFDHSFLCVAETRDGIHFRRCEVNLLPESPCAVLNTDMTRHLVSGQNTAPAVTSLFADTNPACPPDERIKMIVSDEVSRPGGMFLFVSEDGFHFRQKGGRFPLSKKAAYDSSNLAFYDATIGKYRLYHRCYRFYGSAQRRMILANTTEDFVHFEPDDQYITFDPHFESLFYQGQELYTSLIQPYFRAPHILIGFPTRYYDGPAQTNHVKWLSPAIQNLTDTRLRLHCATSLREGTALTETLLIGGRDGLNFTGYGEAFLRPGPQRDDAAWFYGDDYFAYGMIPTRSHLGHGAPDELSFYYTEGYRGHDCTSIRRCSIRMDGFVSIHFPDQFRRMTTKPFIFKGGRLSLNIESGAFGRFRIGFLDEHGTPIPGYTVADSYEQTGDGIELIQRWVDRGNDVRPLEGRVVSMVIEARDTDFYSFQFLPWEPEPDETFFTIK